MLHKEKENWRKIMISSEFNLKYLVHFCELKKNEMKSKKGTQLQLVDEFFWTEFKLKEDLRAF